MNGFGQVTVRAKFDTLGATLFCWIAGDHNDMRRWTAFFDSRQDCNAIDRSHFDIENSEGEVYAINIDECLAAIERGSYSIAFFGKNSVYQHQKVWFVVHEKKRRLHDALNRVVGVYYVVMVHAL